VLGFSPGSASDDLARAIVPALARELGRAIEIELIPGNNGAHAAASVAAAEADGRTLFMATLGTHALAPHLGALPYDPVRDFAPVSLVAAAPLVLACRPQLGPSSAAGLIELARERPRTLAYGTSAVGGAPHLATGLFEQMAGIEMLHIRYDLTSRLYEDLEAGRLALTFNNMMSILPRCRAGRLQALAVTSAARSPAAQDIPTLTERALPGYEVSNWQGIVAPRATPRAVLDDLSAAIASALASETVVAAFGEAGVTACGSTPEEFAAFVLKEMTRWGPVVKRLHGVSRVVGI
jgi:tripartite-type tricarboxylate transporter receptor subunit TctC